MMLFPEKWTLQVPSFIFALFIICHSGVLFDENSITITVFSVLIFWVQEHEKVRHLGNGNTGRSKLENEISSIKEILRSSVPCPHCGTGITRVSGCNHMLCRNCGKLFCYGCGKPLTPGHTRYILLIKYDLSNILSHGYSLDTESEPVLPFESEQCRLDYEKLTKKVDSVVAIRELQKKLKVRLGGHKPRPCPNCHQITYKVKFWWLPNIIWIGDPFYCELKIALVYFFHTILLNQDSCL